MILLYYVHIFLDTPNNVFAFYAYILPQLPEKLTKAQCKFFIGNGVSTRDIVKATNDLMKRDHKKILLLLQDYFSGNLGTYFVPQEFFSHSPEVIKPFQYEATPTTSENHKAKIKGENAERFMFDSLYKYYQNSKNDVVVLHSHQFLADADKKGCEKDFVVFNLSKGYMMIIETKSTASRGMYKKAEKQLRDGKSRLEEICAQIAETTKWKFCGVLFAMVKSVKPPFTCDCNKKCSLFCIVGEEAFEFNFRQIEEEIAKSHEEIWIPSNHIEEFVELMKLVMFKAQGNSCAPVTMSNIVDLTEKHVLKAGTPFAEMFFWTLEQLSLVQAHDLKYVYLDAFYSCGKTEALKHLAKHWNEENNLRSEEEKNAVHYLVNRPKNLSLKKLPLTLILEKFFDKTNVQVKETDFQVGKEPVGTFLEKNGIQPNDSVCFDEVICIDYSRNFSDGLQEMAKSVASLWVAIGAKPVTGRYKKPLKKSGFFCPTLDFALRNPLKIAEEALRVSQKGHNNYLEQILQNPINLDRSSTSIVHGQLIKLSEIHFSVNEALRNVMLKLPKDRFALFFIDHRQISDLATFKQSMNEMFSSRSPPIIWEDTEDEKSGDILQKWLLIPKSRKNDMVMIGVDHACNGIETNIVVHVYPEDCPECGISCEDPVIISRSTAMLILARYQRILPCFHCQEAHEEVVEESHEESGLDSQALLGNSTQSQPWSLKKRICIAIIIGCIMACIITTCLFEFPSPPPLPPPSPSKGKNLNNFLSFKIIRITAVIQVDLFLDSLILIGADYSQPAFFYSS